MRACNIDLKLKMHEAINNCYTFFPVLGIVKAVECATHHASSIEMLQMRRPGAALLLFRISTTLTHLKIGAMGC